jgi:hypothetical protein
MAAHEAGLQERAQVRAKKSALRELQSQLSGKLHAGQVLQLEREIAIKREELEEKYKELVMMVSTSPLFPHNVSCLTSGSVVGKDG